MRPEKVRLTGAVENKDFTTTSTIFVNVNAASV